MVVFGRTAALITVMAGGAAVLTACTSGDPAYTPPPTPPSTAASSTASALPAPAFADPGAVANILRAAEAAVVAVNTYSYRSLKKDLSAAKARTTGDYRDRLEDAYAVIEKQAPRTKALQQATVDHAGLVMLGPKGVKADVLVGGTLRTARENVDPSTQRFTSIVTMSRSHGRWLASGQSAPDGVEDAPRGNDALHHAFGAAKSHLPGLYTFRHAHFDADYDKLLSYTSGDARAALTARRDAIDAQMQKQETDSKGALRALSVVAASDDSGGSVEVFALLDASTRFEGVQGASRHWQVDATLTRSDGHWLITGFTAVQVT